MGSAVTMRGMSAKKCIASLVAVLACAGAAAQETPPAGAAGAVDLGADARGVWSLPSGAVEIPAAYQIFFESRVGLGDQAQVRVRKWFGGETWSEGVFVVSAGERIGRVARGTDGVERDFSTPEVVQTIPTREFVVREVNGQQRREYLPLVVRHPVNGVRDLPRASPDGAAPEGGTPSGEVAPGEGSGEEGGAVEPPAEEPPAEEAPAEEPPPPAGRRERERDAPEQPPAGGGRPGSWR